MEEDTKYEKLARKLKEAQEERRIEVHNVYQAKQKLEELEEEFEAANKSHRVIKEEIADLKDQVLEGEKAAGEVEKAKHYLIKERDELQKMLRPVVKMIFNSHVTRKGNAWKFVKTLHVKFFPFGQKWPSRIVTVNCTRGS